MISLKTFLENKKIHENITLNTCDKKGFQSLGKNEDIILQTLDIENYEISENNNQWENEEKKNNINKFILILDILNEENLIKVKRNNSGEKIHIYSEDPINEFYICTIEKLVLCKIDKLVFDNNKEIFYGNIYDFVINNPSKKSVVSFREFFCQFCIENSIINKKDKSIENLIIDFQPNILPCDKLMYVTYFWEEALELLQKEFKLKIFVDNFEFKN